MIVGYHRPNNLDEALTLLARNSPPTYPMGGGTKLNKPSTEQFEVVDLQTLALQSELGLGQLKTNGNFMEVGASVPLENLLSFKEYTAALDITVRKVLKNELTFNLRQVATVGGTIVSSTGRSGFTTLLLAMDADLELAQLGKPNHQTSLGDYLVMRNSAPRRDLILKVRFPLNVNVSYLAVSRTPSDFPIVSAAVAIWPSKRTRVSLGGYGKAPTTVFDGPDSNGAGHAAREAYQNAEDQWESSLYRSSIAEKLVNRNLSILQEKINE